MLHLHYVSAAVMAWLLLAWLPLSSYAISAGEILDTIASRYAGKTFRSEMRATTYKGGKKASEKAFWLMGETGKDSSKFFIEFVEPEESKGLRFLFLLHAGKPPRVFMHVPSVGSTVEVQSDDPSRDIGGTGVNFDDLMAVSRQAGPGEEYLGEENIDGRPCHLIRINLPGNRGHRLLWITKDKPQAVKSESVGSDGKVSRASRVVEFFETQKGQLLPREQEIDIPGDGAKIRVRAMHGIEGIVIPEELMDPETFGTYQWRLPGISGVQSPSLVTAWRLPTTPSPDPVDRSFDFLPAKSERKHL